MKQQLALCCLFLISVLNNPVNSGILRIPIKKQLPKAANNGSVSSKYTVVESLNLLAYARFDYKAAISLGTPPQTLNVVFDLGSFQTWVRSASCTTPKTCGKNLTSYDLNKSSTSSNTYISSGAAGYADGTSYTGTFILDTLSLAGKINLPRFKFIDATSVTRPDLDGIIGMAFPYSGVSGDNMIARLLSTQAGTLDSNVVCYYIDASNLAGEIEFGGIDYTKFSNPIQWINVAIYGYGYTYIYWQVVLQPLITFTTGDSSGTTTSATITDPSDMLAVFDTGTEFVYASQGLAGLINTGIGATLNTTLSATANFTYSLPSCNLSSLPSFTLTLGQKNNATVVTFTPADYVYFVDSAGTSCVSAVVGMPAWSYGLVIGNVFLRKWYSVFDFGNYRIGITDAIRSNTFTSSASASTLTNSARISITVSTTKSLFITSSSSFSLYKTTPTTKTSQSTTNRCTTTTSTKTTTTVRKNTSSSSFYKTTSKVTGSTSKSSLSNPSHQTSTIKH